ncbi:uncharacterized protein LOC127663491 [Xyrauchen texanus]|uniref:uncharacterized protein LOC127663491 n=1 Tax=Xyrauchen texanus TaxID=154827 RepID=UPI002242B2B7|nr:uncharacterized protein LOC127663491 [Xyrauchen texanus]
MNYMHQSLPAKPCQNMISKQNVLQQKLTCSQLIHFLRTNARVEQLLSSGPDVKYRAGTADGSFTPMQQLNTAPIEGHKINASARGSKDVKNDQICCDVSEPFFEVKDRSTDCVAYRWMITSSSELWDIGDVLTGMNQSLPEPLPNKVKEFLFQDDWKVPNAFSQSICPSSEESTQIDDVKDGDGETIRIPEFQIRKFEEMPVVTTQIVNPNKFFIQHKDTHLCELSEVLLSSKSGRSFVEMNRIPDIGAYVSVWFPKQEMWCRAQVSKICGLSQDSKQRDFTKIEVEVSRIDYGDVGWVSLENIKELCGEMAARSVQALQVSLANIIPSISKHYLSRTTNNNKQLHEGFISISNPHRSGTTNNKQFAVRPVNGELWSVEAISWFKSKVQNKTLYARLYPQSAEVSVELFMQKGKIGAMRRGDSLSVRLVQHGFARYELQKRKILTTSHVQPQTKLQSLEWEKYLISCYCHNRK